MKVFLLWVIALIITLSAAVYQRMTGPTYPKRISTEINNKPLKFKLLRSENTDVSANIEIPNRGDYTAVMHFRKFPTSDPWDSISFVANGEYLTASLPALEAAGKYEYYLELNSVSGSVYIAKDEPVKIRFKDPVPTFILGPHVFAMFLAMLLANLAALMAIFRLPRFRFYTNLTFIFLTLGGMVLGPIVQKYAFGEYWTGVPFGWDLTDNKLLIGFLLFLAAMLGNLKKERQWLTITAAIMLLIIYSIPHSMFGSELDHNSGKIIQGFVMPIISILH
jgi:hypothetical protein